MLELADIFREYGPTYRAKYGDKMLPSHTQVMWDIEHCRTSAMSGDLWYCEECDLYHYSYHSCGNRHCPKCEADRADVWRDKQLEKLLPVPSFLVTLTLPHEFNALAHSNQKLFYSLLFKTSADALQTLARNPKYVGGKIAMVGVLHTWDRSMGYHLHVHPTLHAGESGSLEKDLECPLRTGRQWENSSQIPGPLCLPRGAVQSAARQHEAGQGHLSL